MARLRYKRLLAATRMEGEDMFEAGVKKPVE